MNELENEAQPSNAPHIVISISLSQNRDWYIGRDIQVVSWTRVSAAAAAAAAKAICRRALSQSSQPLRKAMLVSSYSLQLSRTAGCAGEVAAVARASPLVATILGLLGRMKAGLFCCCCC